MKKSLLFVLLAVVFVFSSCNYMGNLQIEKRHYRNGYYVHHSGKSSENKTVAADNETVVAENENVAAIMPAIEKEEMRPAAEAHAAILPAKESPATAHKKFEAAPQSRMTPMEKKGKAAEKIRPVISQLKQGSKPKQTPSSSDAGVNEIVMIILAIFLSPLAVYLKEGVTNRFWIDLICWLLGGGLFFSPFFYGGALMLFAIIFALLIVLDVI